MLRTTRFRFAASASSSSSSSAKAALPIPSEYIPRPVAGRQWATQTQQRAAKHKDQVAALFGRKGHDAVAHGTAAFRETEAAVRHLEEDVKPNVGYYSVPAIDYALHDGVPPLLSKTQANMLLRVHHEGIVRRLNELTLGSIYEGHPLDAVIMSTAFDAENAAVHTLACEHWNHSFAWKSMVPFGSAPSALMREALTTGHVRQMSQPAMLDQRIDNMQERALAHSLTGVEALKRLINDACRDAAAVGGGWVFVVSSTTGQDFEVLRYTPGTSPITSELIPLLGINMQYHARYVDYAEFSAAAAAASEDGRQRGEEAAVQAYIDNAINCINWKLAERNFLLTTQQLSDGA